MEISLDEKQLYSIIQRFRSKLKYKNGAPMYEKNKPSNKEGLFLLHLFTFQTPIIYKSIFINNYL